MKKEYDKELAIQMYKDGVDVKKIAETVGISLGTLNILVNNAGLEKRKRPTAPAFEIKEMYESGMTIAEIRKETGSSLQRIKNIIEEPEQSFSFIQEIPSDDYEKELPKPTKCEYYGKKYLDVSALYM